jgi:hypothetical protein
LARFTSPNNSSGCIVPQIAICLFFLRVQVEFKTQILHDNSSHKKPMLK